MAKMYSASFRLKLKAWNALELNDFACPPIMLSAGAVLPPKSRKQLMRGTSSINVGSKKIRRYIITQDPYIVHIQIENKIAIILNYLRIYFVDLIYVFYAEGRRKK